MTATQVDKIAADLEFWLGLLGNPKWTAHSYKVLVSLDADNDILIKELASIYYLQLCHKWPVDVPMLVEYTADHRGQEFIKMFIRYFVSNKPYCIAQLKEDLLKKSWTKKWLRYMGRH